MSIPDLYSARSPLYESLHIKGELLSPNSHYETLKKLFQEAKVALEERPKQKWGPNYKKGPVEYNVLRVGGNRLDFLFDISGKLVAVSR